MNKKKIAFVFPGQGSQFIGMGNDFYNEFSACKRVYDLASEITGLDIAKICFQENEWINNTDITQIAVCTTSIAILEAVRLYGFDSEVNAGLSLGEYTALYASHVLALSDVLWLVRRRGILMNEAYKGESLMAAVLSKEINKIEQACAQTDGAAVANYNSPMQTVITGEKTAVLEVIRKLDKFGINNKAFLNVSGPFHSELLKPAGLQLAKELEQVKLNKVIVPYVANVNAQYITEHQDIKKLLVEQITSPVKWQMCVERMIQEGIETFIEIGPGKSLTNFIRQINNQVSVYSIQTLSNLEEFHDDRKRVV